MRAGAGPVAGRQASSWASPIPWPFDRRVVCADLALLATICAIVGLFALSPVALEGLGIAHVTSGGLAEIHPAAMIAVVALVLRCLSARNPIRAAWGLAGDDAGVVLLLGAAAIATLCALRGAHAPFTPLVDTFVLPVLVFLLLRDIDPTIRRLLAILLLLIFCANAITALAEVLRHWHLIRGEATLDWRAGLAGDWRATALLGHPVTNGLAAGGFVICLAAAGTRWIPVAVKVPVVLLQGVAMLAFGARTALVLSLVSSPWLLGSQGLARVRAGRRLGSRRVALVMVAIAILVLMAFLLAGSGFADREGLELGIESSWAGLVLAHGLAATAIIVTGLAAISLWLLRSGGRGTGLVLAYFLVLASVTAIPSTTTSFAMTVAMVLIFLEQDTHLPWARTSPRLGAA